MTVLRDGFSTMITFAQGAIEMYQKDATPPGIDGGGAIDVSTFENSEVETSFPNTLKKTTDGAMTVAYDTAVYTSIDAQVNVNQLITITFIDGSKVEVWGWIYNFQPATCEKGEQPTAECGFHVSNLNDSGVETKPVRTAAVI